MKRQWTLLLPLVLTLLLISACGKSSPSAPALLAPPDVAGLWSGGWASLSLVRMGLEQTGDQVSGWIQLRQGPFPAAGQSFNLSGRIGADNVLVWSAALDCGTLGGELAIEPPTFPSRLRGPTQLDTRGCRGGELKEGELLVSRE